MGGISIISGLLIALFVKEPPRRAVVGDPDAGKFKTSDIGTILRIPTLGLLVPSLLLITSMVLFAFMVTTFVKVFGFTTPQGAVLYTVFIAGFGISGFFGGAMGDAFEKKFGPKGRVMLMQGYLAAFAVMTYLMLQLPWKPGQWVFYVVVFFAGLVGSIGFSGCVLPMVGSVLEPKYAATGFALLFSFIQGAITAVYVLLIGPVSKALGGLQPTLLWAVSVPYAINAIYWFVFYKFYPNDVAKRKARMAGKKI